MKPKPTKAIRAAALVRVSTSKQETDRQEAELLAAAGVRGWEVAEIVREAGISGASRKRPGLDRIRALVEAGEIDKVLVHEVSRIGRKNSVVHGFIEFLTDEGVSLYWHSQAIETLLDNGKPNPAAGIMLAVLAEMARAERETLRERINSGLREARRKGRTLGRPTGSTMDDDELLAKHSDVARLLRAGQSIRNASKISGKSKGTVEAVKKAMERGAK